MEKQARDYLANKVEPILCSLLKKLAIDRPINTRQYIIENLRLQGALETKEKEARNSRKDQEAGQDDDSKMEKDTLQAEGEYDLNTLMFPDGYLPTDKLNFLFQYNMALLKGWVRQTSPACAASSVAGAWNALLVGGEGRNDASALYQPDVVEVYVKLIEEQIAVRHARLERLLEGSVIPIEAAVIEQLRLLGKRFGEKGEANVKKSEAMAVLRAVVATNVETGKPYKTLSEAFAADDLKNHPEDVDDEGGDDDDTSDDLKTEMWGLFSRRAAMERISKPNPSTADIGNSAVREAVTRLSNSREGGQVLPRGTTLAAYVAFGRASKKSKAETKITSKDDDATIAEQWLKLREMLGRADTP
mmetsp:Transcript_38427/g.64557  ORF Transcript_38427/g.64557 Transcript_38427/m.64557 type:complete len:360 (+) Transcript_38427:153-1232(+)